MAELIQRDKLISYIDDKFTLYNRLLTEADYDPEKTYKTTSDFDLALTLYGDQRHDSGTLSGRITAITKGAGANMKGDLQLDLTDFNDSLLTGAEKETLDMLKKMRNISAEAIFDGEGGSLYLKSSLLPLWMESAAGLKFSESDWLFVSFFEGLSQEELDSVREFLTLMKDPGEMTMGEILYRSWVGEGGSTWTVNLYEQLMSSISMMEIFLGDSNFKHRGNSYVLEMGRFELMMQIAAASGAKITDCLLYTSRKPGR